MPADLTEIVIVLDSRGRWILHNVQPGPVNDGTDRPSHETNQSLMQSERIQR